MSAAEKDRDSKTKLAVSIKMAWAAVEESGVPDHVQELAFKEALRSLLCTVPQNTDSAGRGAARSTPQVKTKSGADAGGGDQPTPMTEDNVLQKVLEETGVSVDKLAQVFHIDDGVVKLIGQHTKYGSTTTDQARTIAQIVTVVRKLGMGHSDTSFEVIKEACESKHCYDSKNFASKHMPGIDGFVVKGENKSRRLEARGSGVSAFADLIDKILGIA